MWFRVFFQQACVLVHEILCLAWAWNPLQSFHIQSLFETHVYIHLAAYFPENMGSQTAAKIPRLNTFHWPPRGSIESMDKWTFQKGMTTFDTRTNMQGRQVDSPLLPPKSQPPRRDSCAFKPSTGQTSHSGSFSAGTGSGKYQGRHSAYHQRVDLIDLRRWD